MHVMRTLASCRICSVAGEKTRTTSQPSIRGPLLLRGAGFVSANRNIAEPPRRSVLVHLPLAPAAAFPTTLPSSRGQNPPDSVHRELPDSVHRELPQPRSRPLPAPAAAHRP